MHLNVRRLYESSSLFFNLSKILRVVKRFESDFLKDLMSFLGHVHLGTCMYSMSLIIAEQNSSKWLPVIEYFREQFLGVSR